MMKNKHRLSPFLLMMTGELFLSLAGDHALAAGILDASIGDYQLVSKKKISRVVYEYVYTARITNRSGNQYANVKASVTSRSPHTVIVDDSLGYGNVPAGVSLESTETFTIRQDRRYPYDPNDLTWTVTGVTISAFPPWPAPQFIGLYDTPFHSLPTDACRGCHNDPDATDTPNTKEMHHQLEGRPIQASSDVPYRDDSASGPGDTYECASCHILVNGEVTLPVERECHACHVQGEGEATVHHATQASREKNCKACHELIDNPFDGHYIPTYQASLVTPMSGLGLGPGGSGGCAFCHRGGLDQASAIVVHENVSLHHSTGVALPPFMTPQSECGLCHALASGEIRIRTCETCHGVLSLHNIQGDSNDDGNISAGEEFPYYGHIGNPKDCLGCHGYSADGYAMQTAAGGDESPPAPMEGSKTTAVVTVAPPPVRQRMGLPDGPFNMLTEEKCRACHEDPTLSRPGYLADRHHLLLHMPVPVITDMPYSTALQYGGDGTYNCLSCHRLLKGEASGKYLFESFRDCLLCHGQKEGEATVHHRTPAALERNCKACHGPVDNPGDGHYIPTYQASLVTPRPGLGTGVGGSGGCAFCHGEGKDPATGIQVFSNIITHHATGVVSVSDQGACSLCHAWTEESLGIRACETCHGITSLHSIQADGNGDGVVFAGSEPAYFGHVGNHDDCWGCHGFTSEDGGGEPAMADRHHVIVNTPVPPDSVKPYSGVSEADDFYTCLSCHRLVWNQGSNVFEFTPFRECSICHEE